MSNHSFASARALQQTRYNAIDLFSGCGGLTLGLKQAGFTVLSAIELDPAAARTYSSNHSDVALKNSDIRKVSAAGLCKELKLRPGDLDLLAGCPPCQGFSALRTRNGASRNRDERNGLVHEMVRFARAFRPKAIMMENVPGLAGRTSFRQLCADLKRLGYSLSFEIKDAANFGVPQRRRRLILLGTRNLNIIPPAASSNVKTVRDAIGKLCDPSESSDPLHKMPERRSESVMQLIRDIPKDGGSRGDLPVDRQLKCHRRSNGFNDVYGRMAWEKVAPTITGGCFNPSKGRFLHPEKDRAITLREAALLQGFPENYVFDVSAGKEALALMIGNALPPEFIRRHALQIKRAIESSLVQH